MGQHISDKLLDVAGVALQVVHVGQLPLLVLQHLEGLLQPVSEGSSLTSELGQLIQCSSETLDQLVSVGGDIVISCLELLAIGLKLVEFSSAEDISTSLNKFSNDVNSVVDWSVVVINIILDVLQTK